MKKLTRLPLAVFLVTVLVFFSPFLIQGRLPIPADTIVGLYHPFRDAYAKEYPNGIPFKNFLITDPVRQQYPWRLLAIEQIKRFELPLWNPYTLAGTPLLANVQNAAFYPLNIVFFVIPFPYAWSLLVLLQPVLGGVFLYLYLRNLKLKPVACWLAALAFSFSGFSIAWLEWNTIGHAALWLPLALLATDKIAKSKKITLWSFVLVFSLVSGLFAGHLQTFFYSFLISFIYGVLRWLQQGEKIRLAFHLGGLYVLFIVVSSVLWLPAMQYILYSAREIDLTWQKPGWFIPWKHLVQFVAPDFFGNPTTLNYWGEWNYGEFVGYIGIFPLLMAGYALFFRFDKKTLFFGILFYLSLIFSLPTFFAKLPFLLDIPFISTAQPTRLLFLTDFSLAVLAALGVDAYARKPEKTRYVLIPFVILLCGLFLFTYFAGDYVSADNLAVAKRNLIFPLIILFAITCVLASQRIITQRFSGAVVILLLVITAIDLLRFGNKFTPFTGKEYLYPTTKTLAYLSKHAGITRIMATDPRILPPNMTIPYNLQTVNGYDPLYLLQYGEFVAASERGKADIRPPFGFNRIITPQQVKSVLTDMLGVKYVMSLSDIDDPDLKKVYQEGQTQLYENTNALPRAYFVHETLAVNTKHEALQKLFDTDFDPSMTAILENPIRDLQSPARTYAPGKATIVTYNGNRIVIRTDIPGDSSGFLVLSDTYYPTWKVKIDGKERIIIKTNYSFRGVQVPGGKHTVEFSNSLFSAL